MKRLLFGVALAAAGSAGFVGQAAAQNLLVNPGFEELGGSYDGWTVFGGGPQISTLTGVDGIARSGFACAKIFGEFTDCDPGSGTFTVGGFLQSFDAVPGDVYEFSGFSLMLASDAIPGTDFCRDNRLIAQIAFFETGGTEPIASNEAVIADNDFPTDSWESFFVSAPAPANAGRVEALFLFLQPACDTGSGFVDDVKFRNYTPISEPNVLANPNFDDSLAGWGFFGNAFYDGNPYAARTPDGGLKMFSTFVADEPSGVFQSFATSPGETWQLDAHALSTCVAGMPDEITGANDNYTTARIVFRDSGGGEVGAEEVLLRDASFDLGTWNKVSVTATAPAGAVAAEAFLLFVSPSLLGGSFWYDDIRFGAPSAVSTPDAVGSLPFTLAQNAPNPFNPRTRISFDLAAGGDVELVVYDVAGRRVASLLQGALDPGRHSVVWDGTAADGTPVASGVYRYELNTDQGRTSRRMTLLK